jgi:hypothetical protein
MASQINLTFVQINFLKLIIEIYHDVFCTYMDEQTDEPFEQAHYYNKSLSVAKK